MKIVHASAALAILLASQARSFYDDLRVALLVSPDAPINTGFLDRVRGLNYNYVTVQAAAATWPDSWDGKGNILNADMENGLKAWFQQVDDAGMRMIPLFPVGNRYSQGWKAVNAGIDDNTYLNNGVVTSVNPHAPDPEFDRTFNDFLQAMGRAWSGVYKRAPGFPSDLQYILLGKDEIIDFTVPIQNILIARGSSKDLDWIAAKKANSPGMAESWYYQALMADELLRRVRQIRAVFPKAHVMVYADMWDNQYLGKLSYNTHDRKLITTSGALDLPGLSTDQINEIKASVIFIPWRYDTWWNGGVLEQDWLAAFKRFKQKGFRFMAATSIDPAGMGVPFYRNWGDMVTAMRWIRTPELQTHAVGFCSQPYPSGQYDMTSGASTWSTLEVGARLGKKGRSVLFRNY